MLNRLMGVRILLIVALASSAVAFAQNGQRGTQRGQAGTAGKPFDPHDLSGFWDITNIGLPRRRPERNEQQSAADDAVGFGKVSQDEDGSCQRIKQWKLTRTKKIGMIRSGGVIRRVFHASCGTPRRRE